MANDLASRIKTRRQELGWSQAELGRRVSVAEKRKQPLTREAVSQWESGGSPEAERLRNLAVVLDVNYEWLASGRGPKSGRATGLPLYGEIAAGVWAEVPENQDMDVERVPVAPDPRFPADYQYALRIKGNSVDRIAKDGTIITLVDIFKAGLDVREGDLVCVERSRGGLVETTVKRVRKGKGGLELWPESTDPAQNKPIPWRPKGKAEDVTVEVTALVIGVFTPIARGT